MCAHECLSNAATTGSWLVDALGTAEPLADADAVTELLALGDTVPLPEPDAETDAVELGDTELVPVSDAVAVCVTLDDTEPLGVCDDDDVGDGVGDGVGAHTVRSDDGTYVAKGNVNADMLKPEDCSANAYTSAPAFKSVACVALKTTDMVIGAPALAEMAAGNIGTSGPNKPGAAPVR